MCVCVAELSSPRSVTSSRSSYGLPSPFSNQPAAVKPLPSAAVTIDSHSPSASSAAAAANQPLSSPLPSAAAAATATVKDEFTAKLPTAERHVNCSSSGIKCGPVVYTQLS